jgi:hypothetical protein
VLEITYQNRTLYEKCNENPILLPELRPLYELDDCIAFGYSVEPLNPKQLRLSDAGQKLWNVLRNYVE